METKRYVPIGGQALPGGVMMRSPQKTAFALRHHSGKLLIASWPNKHSRIVKMVFFRGIYQLFISLKASYRTIGEAVKLSRTAGKMRISPLSILCVFGIIILLGLYAFASDWLYTKLNAIMLENGQHYLLTFMYGVADLCIFSVSLFIITRLPAVKKMLRYHGAEHKAIACYEKGLDMTVDNVTAQSRYHKRCGTSMVVTVMLVAVIVPVFIPPTLADIWQEMILAACLLFAVGIAYEGKRSKSLTMLNRLGMAAQRLTTQEPSDEMIECAIAAVNEVINGA